DGNGAGGTVRIVFTDSYIDTAGAVASADGVRGGHVTVEGGATGRLFSSGSHRAPGGIGGVPRRPRPGGGAGRGPGAARGGGRGGGGAARGGGGGGGGQGGGGGEGGRGQGAHGR